MSSSSYLQLGSVEALVVRKDVKNLHLSVLPPNGWVRVTAPEHMGDDAVRTLLAMRLPWIKRQQAKFAGQDRQTKREYASGESHYFFGKRYCLVMEETKGHQGIVIKNKTKMALSVHPGSSAAQRERIMMRWYREALEAALTPLIEKWQGRLGVTAKEWGIKRMKTRWGTCNRGTGRTWFNLELAKKPLPCVEYVVVHELLHLIEKKHNDRFTRLLSQHLPKWRSLKDELNRFILSHEDWKR